MTISDDAFIRIWRRCNGDTNQVCEMTGCKIRNVFARRRRIEQKYDISLTAQKAQIEERTQTRIKHHEAKVDFKIKNGVVMVGGDCHYWPGPATTAHRGFVSLCRQLKPQAVVMNGDVFDGSSISRFPSIGWQSVPEVRQELDAVDERLKEIEEAARGAKRFWTAGNHDLRFESRLATLAPQYRGIDGIELHYHFPQWTPCWLVDVNDTDTIIRHREKGGIHAAYRNTLEGGVTMVTGHDHIADVKPYKDYKGKTRYGVRAGMMADSASDRQFRDYLEGRQPNWHSGFCVLTWKDGELLMPELCLKWDDNHVQFRGEVLKV